MEAREITDVSWTRTSGHNRLVIMVKDPATLFAYWEVDAFHKRIICEHFHTEWGQLQFFLQVYDVSDIWFDGHNAHSTQRIQVHPDSDNWYITVLQPGRTYLVDLGTLNGHGQFFSILRSNVLGTPPYADARSLQPAVRFGKYNSSANTDNADSWREQFDGYHLAHTTGGDA